MPTVDEFFEGHDLSRAIYEAVLREVQALGPLEMRASKSQIAFRRGRGFAWVWLPEMYLRRKAAPLVLSLAFGQRDLSPRWKEVVEPRPGRFMHHLELYTPADVDEEVSAWLRAAWEDAR
jgi:hypothetical protein